MILFVDETLCSSVRERKDRERDEHRHELLVDAAVTGGLGRGGRVGREWSIEAVSTCSATTMAAKSLAPVGRGDLFRLF